MMSRLAINEDVIFSFVHFYANMIFQPALKGSTIWNWFKVGWEGIPHFAGRKKKDFAPDDFTCGKTRDCTLCLVEIECRSLTLLNSISRSIRRCRPMNHTVYFTRVNYFVRHAQEFNLALWIQHSHGAIWKGDWGQIWLFYFVKFVIFASQVSEDHHAMQSRHNQS